MIAPKRRTRWQRANYRRERHFRRIRRQVIMALNDQFRPVLLALSVGLMPTDTLIREEPIRRIYRDVYVRVGLDFAQATYGQAVILKRTNPERKSFFVQAMERFVLTQAAERISSITNTTKDYVRKTLAKAVAEGWGIGKLATVLRTEWNVISRLRAVTIARTEMITASTVGALEGAREARRVTGIKLNKRWLSTRDSRTRDSHRAANGQTVGMDEDFTINGYAMAGPGDSSKGAPASEIVKCRCAIAFQRAKA